MDPHNGLSGKSIPIGRILVVDDDALVRGAFRRMLESAGYDVVVANGGAQALQTLRTDRSIGLMLLDLDMPGMDGTAVRQTQLADPAIATIPTIIVSGSLAPDVEPTIRGADGYLRKPVTRGQLLDAVRRYCAPRE